MSDALNHKINRRQLLKIGLAAGGVFALRPTLGMSEARKGATRWAFLSDTHIAADPENNYRKLFPYRNLQKAVSQINVAQPEGLVITGDLARLTGQIGDYENLRTLLAPTVSRRPAYLALGNHDDRANFRKVFAKPAGNVQPVKGKHVVTVEAGPARFILLDSLLYANKVQGLLGKAQRTWLANYLRSSDDKPTILFFHHTLGDGDGDLLDVPRLFEIVKAVPKVKAIVYGHSHVYGFSELEGIHLINLPALGYNFSDNQPVGWVEAMFTKNGVEMLLHATGGNTAMDGRVDKLRWRS